MNFLALGGALGKKRESSQRVQLVQCPNYLDIKLEIFLDQISQIMYTSVY